MGRSYAILLLLALTAFGGLLTSPFLYDDTVVIGQNQLLRSPSGLKEIWRGHVDDRHEMDGVVRPLLLTFLSAVGQAGHFRPVVFRLSSVALHALVALLLLYWVRRTFQVSQIASWVVALVFLLHPVQTTNLAMVWKQSDIWIALGALSSLLLMDRSIWLSLLVFVLSLGFKESALVIPLLWLATEPIRTETGRHKRLWITGLALAASYLLHISIRNLAQAPTWSEFFPGGRWSYFLTELAVFPLYAKALLWPASLTIDRSVPVATAFSLPIVLSVLIVFALIVFAAIRAWKRSRVAIALLLAVIWLIPTSSFQPLSILYDETRLYLALGLLVLALVCWLAPLTERVRLRPVIAWAAIGTFALALVVVGQRGTERWKSEEALWRSALRVDATSVRTLYQLGFLAQNARALDEAEEYYRAALRMNPSFSSAHLQLGIVLGQKGDLDGAAGEFSQLLSAQPHWVALGHYHLGLDAIYRKQFERAHHEFETLRKLSPESGLADRGEAFLFETVGKKDDAIAAWRRYLSSPAPTNGEREAANRAISRLAAVPGVR